MEDIWLTRAQLAGRWHMPKSTLNQWAAQGKGPRYALFGRHARYRLSDVIAWETAQFAPEQERAATDATTRCDDSVLQHSVRDAGADIERFPVEQERSGAVP